MSDSTNSAPVTRVQQYVVERCPHCSQRHQFALSFGQRSTLTFAGPSSRAGLACPATGGPIVVDLELGADETYLGPINPLADSAGTTAVPVVAAGVVSDNERAEWRKGSRSTALDFCRTMLTTSSGAIAVYTAVLKYVGFEKVTQSVNGQLSVLPMVLFLSAATAFAVALVPTLGTVTDENSFREFRDRRLRLLRNYTRAGTAMFVTAMASSIYFLFAALNTV
ncbi:hypothetical protein [Streptomyces sp. A1547]|uniref:hypothetical protein n=1 Tax=Streptomyces sp. A1547 TaxID=2563105 RepID=UPI00109EC605|nr:hypothetical protein [Streptomyces sp. A1547]THA23365.1 hypothetical protein E6W17_41680 [Streptomyces sp. A1547]